MSRKLIPILEGLSLLGVKIGRRRARRPGKPGIFAVLIPIR